jgi:hypothetical protein
MKKLLVLFAAASFANAFAAGDKTEAADWQKQTRAQQEATHSRMAAQYAAEKKRCKKLSGDKKELCIADAKKKFSKG